MTILEKLRKRFSIRRVILVCDRGMVTAANLQALQKAGYEYIVGTKMRGLLEVRKDVLGHAGRYREVKHNLHVKEVWIGERRYVVCLNPERAEKDRRDREAILSKMRERLRTGGLKRLIANRGYRRFLRAYKRFKR